MKTATVILIALGGLIVWLLFGKRFTTAVTAPPATAPVQPTPQGTGVAGAISTAGAIATAIGNIFSTQHSSPPTVDASYI